MRSNHDDQTQDEIRLISAHPAMKHEGRCYKKTKDNRQPELRTLPLKAAPEVDFKTAKLRRTPYPARIAADGLTIQVGRDRPTKEIGKTHLRSVRLPDSIWARVEARAKEKRITVRAACARRSLRGSELPCGPLRLISSTRPNCCTGTDSTSKKSNDPHHDSVPWDRHDHPGVGSPHQLRGPNPPQPHDQAKKLIVYVRPTERLAVSYTGLAEFVGAGANVPIERWLTSSLESVPSNEAIGVVLSTLTRGLDAQVSQARSRWRLSDTRARLTVVLTGFDQANGHRVLVSISNFEKLGTTVHISRKGENRFRAMQAPETNNFTHGAFTARCAVFNGQGTVSVHGDRSALSRITINRLLGGMRHARKKKLERDAYRDLLVSAIREANVAKPDTIGPTCLSCIMVRDAPTWAVGAHHPGGYDGTWPQLVFPGGRMETYTVSRSEVGVADAAARLASGEDLSLSNASYRAFLDCSAKVQELAHCVRGNGVEVYDLGLLDRDVELLGRAGIVRTSALEAMLQAAMPWAKGYILECVREVADMAAQGQHVLIDNNLIVAYLVAAAKLATIGEAGVIAYFGAERASRIRQLAATYARSAS